MLLSYNLVNVNPQSNVWIHQQVKVIHYLLYEPGDFQAIVYYKRYKLLRCKDLQIRAKMLHIFNVFQQAPCVEIMKISKSSTEKEYCYKTSTTLSFSSTLNNHMMIFQWWCLQYVSTLEKPLNIKEGFHKNLILS